MGLGDGAGTPGAAGEVCGEGTLVLGLESVQRPAHGQFVEGLVVVAPGTLPAGGHRAPPSPEAAPPGTAVPRLSLSRRIPASIRVFTVPSGVPVSAATSRWV
jgi:hypothetical protein